MVENLQDSGGGGGPSSSEEQEAQEGERRRELRRDADSDPMRRQTDTNETRTTGTPTDDVQRVAPGSDPMDGGGSSSGGSPSPPEDVQDAGPGPGGGPSGGGSTGGGGETTAPPDDIQEVAPGTGDSPGGTGGGGTGGGGGGDTGGNQPDQFDRDDPRSDGSDVRADAIGDSGNDSPPDGEGGGNGGGGTGGGTGGGGGGGTPPSPPEPPDHDFTTEETEEEVEVEEAYAEENDVGVEEIDAFQDDEGDWFIRPDPEHELGELSDEYGISESGFDVEQTEEGGFEFTFNEYGAEQQFAAENEAISARDVEATEQQADDGTVTFTVSLTEQGAEKQFAAQDEDISVADVEATEQADGTITLSPTEQAGEATLRGLTDRANQSVSLGTTGLGTSGTELSRVRAERASESVSLGTTGLGTSGTEQSRLREETQRASESVSLGTTGLGTTDQGTPSGDGNQVAPSAEGGLERGSTAETDAQIQQDIEDAQNFAIAQQSNLERETTSGVSPDYATAAENEAESEVRETLDQFGIDPDSAFVEEGMGHGDTNDTPPFVPTQDRDTAAGRAFGAATAPIFEPFGVDGQAVASAAGERYEDALAQGSEAYWNVVEDNVEVGGEAAEDALASSVLGPGVGRQMASDVADLGVSYADAQTDADVEGAAETYTENVYRGAAAVGDVPGAALAVNEAAEYADYGINEIQAGRGGEFVGETAARGAVLATQGAGAAMENPVSVAGQAGGALAGGAVVGAATSSLGIGSAAIRSARQAASRTRSAASHGVNVGSSAVRRTGRGVRSRVPNVEVTRDPDAPALDIDPELRRQISERASQGVEGAGSAARSGVGSARNVAVGAVQGVRGAPELAARNVVVGARRVRQRARDARVRSEIRASQARMSSGPLPSSTALRARAGEGAKRVREGVTERFLETDADLSSSRTFRLNSAFTEPSSKGAFFLNRDLPSSSEAVARAGKGATRVGQGLKAVEDRAADRFLSPGGDPTLSRTYRLNSAFSRLDPDAPDAAYFINRDIPSASDVSARASQGTTRVGQGLKAAEDRAADRFLSPGDDPTLSRTYRLNSAFSRLDADTSDAAFFINRDIPSASDVTSRVGEGATRIGDRVRGAGVAEELQGARFGMVEHILRPTEDATGTRTYRLNSVFGGGSETDGRLRDLTVRIGAFDGDDVGDSTADPVDIPSRFAVDDSIGDTTDGLPMVEGFDELEDAADDADRGYLETRDPLESDLTTRERRGGGGTATRPQPVQGARQIEVERDRSDATDSDPEAPELDPAPSPLRDAAVSGGVGVFSGRDAEAAVDDGGADYAAVERPDAVGDLSSVAEDVTFTSDAPTTETPSTRPKPLGASATDLGVGVDTTQDTWTGTVATLAQQTGQATRAAGATPGSPPTGLGRPPDLDAGDEDDGGSRRRREEGWVQREERSLINPFTGE